MSDFSLDQFQCLLQAVTDFICDSPLDQTLENKLNKEFGWDSETFKAIDRACHAGIDAGALCQHEAGGVKFGRVIEPCADLQGYSVDVVSMKDIKGPHHRHPQGEIDLIMPITTGASFDRRGAGWLVYGPHSSHSPTVDGGEALVLYLLPNGEIEFTRALA